MPGTNLLMDDGPTPVDVLSLTVSKFLLCSRVMPSVLSGRQCKGVLWVDGG